MLGKKVKDKFTGYTGVATNRTEYFPTGIVRYGVEAPAGERGVTLEYFDEARLELVEG